VLHNLLISRRLQKERELPFADFRQSSPIFAYFCRIFSHRFSHGIQDLQEFIGRLKKILQTENRVDPEPQTLRPRIHDHCVLNPDEVLCQDNKPIRFESS
jgi:hypothetical protein